MADRTDARLLLAVVVAVGILCASCAVRQEKTGAQTAETSTPSRTPEAAAGLLGEGAGGAGAPAAPRGGAQVVEARKLPAKLSLHDCFMLALDANKDVHVARLGADAAEARISGAKGEFDPTLFMEGWRGRSNLPVAGVPLGETDTSEGSLSAGIRQRIVTGTNLELAASTDYLRDLTGASTLNPQHTPEVALTVRQDLLRNFGIGINRTNVLLAQNNYQISWEEWRNSVVQNLFEVESAYWDLYFAIADLKVREMQLERANKLVQRAEAQVGVGEAAPIEVARAKSSAATQMVAILNAKGEITKLRHRLLRVMGVLDAKAVDAEFELADAPAEAAGPISLAESLGVALKARPDHTQAELAVKNADLQRKFARNQRLPKLQLFGSASLTGLSDDFSSSVDVLERGRYDTWQAGLLFEWPIPNRTARANYTAADLEHQRAGLRLKAVTERITREVADALADVKTAQGRIASATEAHSLAETLLKAEEKSFSLGRSNSVDVILAQEAAAGAERDVVRARTDYATALANLLRTQGNLLEAKGIAFMRPPAQ